jgi:hypothetical protein
MVMIEFIIAVVYELFLIISIWYLYKKLFNLSTELNNLKLELYSNKYRIAALSVAIEVNKLKEKNESSMV